MARSPNYPAINLREALDRVGRIYSAEKRSAMTPEVAAAAMGYTALHGPARRKLAALRSYGLLEGRGETIRVSDLAMAIMYSKDDAEKAAAMREAALRPELFRELAEQPGASDGNLVATLVRKGFFPDGARKAVASFRETLSLAPASGESYDPDDDEDDDVLETVAPERDKLDLRFKGRVGGRNELHDDVFIWPLHGGVIVQVQVKGGPLTSRNVEMLKRYLDLAKETMGDEAEAGSVSLASASVPPQPSERSPDDAQD